MHTQNITSETHWPRKTVGHHMTKNVPTIHASATLGDVRKMLEKQVQEFETVNYMYVLDAKKRLTGILSIKDVFRLQASLRVGNVCRTDHLITIHPSEHQERAAYISLKHNIKAVPVVDEHHVFLGVLSSDVILHILYHETHEDLLRLAGVLHNQAKNFFDNVLTLPFLTSIRHRIPWLFIGLMGGLVASVVIGEFEAILREHIILASFLPLIVYMSGAVSSQMVTFLVRDIAINQTIPIVRYFMKQFVVAFIIAGVFSILLFIGSSILHDNSHISATLSISLFIAMLSSVASGLVVPLTFHKLHVDPANASGPVATIIQDLLSIVIYFSIATWLL